MSDGCYGCSGRCCYDIIVRVTPFDLQRIATSQRLRFDEMVTPWKEPAPTELGIRLDASDDRYGTILRRHPIEPAACAFLMHVGDETKRCGIYADRPRVCEAYPFEIARGTVDVRADARCGPGDWNLATLGYRARREALARYAADWAGTQRIVAAWNARTPSSDVETGFAAYLAFARAVCDAFDAARPGDVGLDRWNESDPPDEVRAAHERWLARLDEAVAAGVAAI